MRVSQAPFGLDHHGHEALLDDFSFCHLNFDQNLSLIVKHCIHFDKYICQNDKDNCQKDHLYSKSEP
ncbi:hypothetical protein Saga11_07280 [Bacillus safensis]|nr:hypothetical protein Saga11_07280 [Bacillus safensis]